MRVILKKFSDLACSAFALTVCSSLAACSSTSQGVARCNDFPSREDGRVCGTPLSRLIVVPEAFSGKRVEVSGFMLYEGGAGVAIYSSPSLPNRTDHYSCVTVWLDPNTIEWGYVKPLHGVYFVSVIGKVDTGASRRSCSASIKAAKISDVAVVELHDVGVRSAR